MIKNKLKSIFYKIHKTKLLLPAPKFKLDTNLQELSFTIVMMGYNNQDYIKKSIESALSQNYSNFNIIYNEACSTDNSFAILKTIEHPKLTKRINKTRKYRLQNLYEAIHMTDDNQIILELDGDDYLKDEFVLTRLNQMFQKNNYLMIHGNYTNTPIEFAKKHGYGNFSQQTPWFVKKFSMFRDFPWIYSGIRSYYSWLFKKIKQEDLMLNGQFLPVCCDVATIYPMAEMAPNRIGYIQEALLIRNIDSPINEFKVITVEQKKIKDHILNSKRYEKLL